MTARRNVAEQQMPDYTVSLCLIMASNLHAFDIYQKYPAADGPMHMFNCKLLLAIAKMSVA